MATKRIENQKVVLRWLQAHHTLLGNKSFSNFSKDFFYKNSYDFLLREGSFFSCQELNKEEKSHIKKIVGRLGFAPQMKECFYNAQFLALSDSSNKIQYAEGYAYTDLMPILHGFNVINGKVIDITWKNKKDDNKKNHAYYGVALPTQYVRKQMLDMSMATSLIECYENKFDILKKKFEL